MCDSGASVSGGAGGSPTGTAGSDSSSAAAAPAPSPVDDPVAVKLRKAEKSVVTWLSLQNRRLDGENANPRVEKAVEWLKFVLYGDAELVLYMLPAEEWPEEAPLVDFVKMVQRVKGSGWIRSGLVEARFKPGPRTLAAAVGSCGYNWTEWKDELTGAELREARRFLYDECKGSMWNLWLPRGQGDAPVSETITLRDDGNFRMQALRTKRFLFMLCFATS